MLLIVIFFPMLVDEVDGILEDGPVDLKILMNQASRPLTMSKKPFFACHMALSLLASKS